MLKKYIPLPNFMDEYISLDDLVRVYVDKENYVHKGVEGVNYNLMAEVKSDNKDVKLDSFLDFENAYAVESLINLKLKELKGENE